MTEATQSLFDKATKAINGGTSVKDAVATLGRTPEWYYGVKSQMKRAKVKTKPRKYKKAPKVIDITPVMAVDSNEARVAMFYGKPTDLAKILKGLTNE